LYDMYHWDKPADPAPARRRKASPDPSAARLPAPRDGSDPTGSDPAGSDPAESANQAPQATQATQATQAVQFALDRRDNGGDAVTVAGQPTARQTRQ
jgi:hypothetical protein